GLFFVLILWTYARYAGASRRSTGQYVLMLVYFAIGLMCKPTVVTLPFVFLLLDFWPLRRFNFLSAFKQSRPVRAQQQEKVNESLLQVPPAPQRSVRYLLMEKIPFFVLCVASCFATILAQEKTISSLEHLSFGSRI